MYCVKEMPDAQKTEVYLKPYRVGSK